MLGRKADEREREREREKPGMLSREKRELEVSAVMLQSCGQKVIRTEICAEAASTVGNKQNHAGGLQTEKWRYDTGPAEAQLQAVVHTY